MTERHDAPRCVHSADQRDGLRTARRPCARLPHRVAFTAGGIAVLGMTILAPPRPLLVWNASASAPIGLYAVTPGAPPRRGDMALAWAPRGPRALADERRYLPRNLPLVKRMRAVPGDRVCAIGDTIFLKNRRLAQRRARDGAGRPMPWWRGCVTLSNGAILLLMDSPASFDGRYFGVTDRREVIGKATPLWVR